MLDTLVLGIGFVVGGEAGVAFAWSSQSMLHIHIQEHTPWSEVDLGGADDAP